MNRDILNYQFIKKLQVLDFIEEIWLFGSRARGDASSRSDIDLAIICPAATHDDWNQILKIQHNADTLLKIDCIRFDLLEQGDPFRNNILKFKQIVYKRGEVMREIFWKEYFESLGQAIIRLAEVIRHPDLNQNDFMQDAAIQRFEFVIELFWKVMKKILIYEKVDAVTPRDVLNKAYQFHLINEEAIWLQMLDDRNMTSHVYRREDALRVFENIKLYLPVFEKSYAELQNKYIATRIG